MQLIDATLDVDDDLQDYVNRLVSDRETRRQTLHLSRSEQINRGYHTNTNRLVNACELLAELLQDTSFSLESCGCKTDQAEVDSEGHGCSKVKAKVASSVEAQSLLESSTTTPSSPPSVPSSSTLSSDGDGTRVDVDIKVDLRDLLSLGGGRTGGSSNVGNHPSELSLADESSPITVSNLLALVNDLLDGVINLYSLLGQSSFDLSTNDALQYTLGTVNQVLSTLNLGLDQWPSRYCVRSRRHTCAYRPRNRGGFLFTKRSGPLGACQSIRWCCYH